MSQVAPCKRVPSSGCFGRPRRCSPMRRLGPLAVRRRGLALALLLFCVPGAWAEESLAPPPAPADVYLAVMALSVDLEALRTADDRRQARASTADMPPRIVRNAPPRHVLWQAQVLYRRTKAFVDMRAGSAGLPLDAGAWNQPAPRPAPEGRQITSADALQVVQDARVQLRALLVLRNIHVVVLGLERDAAKGNLDVLAKVADVNRQLNLLLQQEFRPQDIYRPVLLAVDHAGDLLNGGYPPQPALDRGSDPLDVHRRLMDCWGLLQSVQRAQGLETLDFDLNREMQRNDIRAADVHDLATSLAADLAYMARRSGAQRRPLPRGEYRMPRRTSFAHVHQLVGVLQAQLRSLAQAPPG